MPNREYEQTRRDDGNQGFRGRDEERDYGMREENRGWQGRNMDRGDDRWYEQRFGRSFDERNRNLSGMGGFERERQYGGGYGQYGGGYGQYGGGYERGMGGYGQSGGGMGGYGGMGYGYGDERWGRGEDRWGRGEERWGRGNEDRWGRGEERWGREQDFRQHPFGFGGMDRGFSGGGYGGYGGRDPYSGGGGWWAREGGGGGPYGSHDLGWEQRGYGREGFRGQQGFGEGMRRQGRAPRSYMRSDERIKEDLCDRLMQSWIDAENVDIQVSKGEVTLTGTVEDRQSKRAVEDLAEQILGVKDVQNHIRVQSERGQQQQSTTTTTTGTTRKPSA